MAPTPTADNLVGGNNDTDDSSDDFPDLFPWMFVALALAIVLCLVLVFFWARTKRNSKTERAPPSFENPLYAGGVESMHEVAVAESGGNDDSSAPGESEI